MGEKEPPPAVEPPPAPGELRPFTFAATDPIELHYLDLRARPRTAIGVTAVPNASRQVVRVTPPTSDEEASGDDSQVHVADLTRPDERGGFTTVLMRRFDFEARALAALPPAEASRFALPEAATGLEPVTPHDQLILYGTTWCGACKDAREFLDSLFVEAVFVDVSRPEGAKELARKAARVGIVADRVPVIDVHGQLLVGFEPDRLRTLLGDRL